MAYFLFVKETPSFEINGEEVGAFWLTARSTTMTIPGGVYLAGSLVVSGDKHFLGTTFALPEGWMLPELIEPAAKKFAKAFDVAWQRKQKMEQGHRGASYEVLAFFEPQILRLKTVYKTPAIVILAYREEDARQAAEEAGLRLYKK